MIWVLESESSIKSNGSSQAVRDTFTSTEMISSFTICDNIGCLHNIIKQKYTFNGTSNSK